MKNLINALQEGRFVELPETNKEKALNYLANLIEAMPDLTAGTDVAGAVLAREAQFNTGIGQGWACPHMRSVHEGEIICAAGWSPAGIDYGACDGKPVHFVVMYYVPDSQKHLYLKEISGLAKAIQSKQGDKDLSKIQTLAQARDWILELVSNAVETQMSDVKARMIHLEAKQAAVTSVPGSGPFTFSNLPHVVIPLSILVSPGARPVVLSQDPELIAKLESGGEIDAGALSKQMPFDLAGYTVLFRAVTNYQARRQLYECLAIKLNGAASTPDKPKI
jgi:PTS system nitrogen regulatory IIA component